MSEIAMMALEMSAVPGTVHQWKAWEIVDMDGQPAPEGPWTHEPTKVQWVDAATGLPCLIVRAALGHLCGYAGVSPGHPLYGAKWPGDERLRELEAHGGVNYAKPCDHGWPDASNGVCHVPEPGAPDDVWWIGFDCGHAFDLEPSMIRMHEKVRGKMRDRRFAEVPAGLEALFEDRYRGLGYVRGLVSGLAAQLKSMEGA